jgi:hypothetical protein
MVVAMAIGALSTAIGCDQDDGRVVDDKPLNSNEADSAPSPKPGESGNTAKLEPQHPDNPTAAAGGAAPSRESNRDGQYTVLFNGYALDVPIAWKNDPISSTMRFAEMTLPRYETDTDAPRLVVYHFPGGGTWETNVIRWNGEFRADTAGRSHEEVEFTTQWAKVQIFDRTGVFQAAQMASGGPGEVQRNWRVLKSMLTVPNGVYFIHVTGPVNSVAQLKQTFIDALKTFRPDDV